MKSSLNDIESRLRTFFGMLRWEQGKPILVVGHSLVFMALFWLFCGKCGPEFEDVHMGRGHLSIISGSGYGFRILKFNVPPGELDGKI